MTFAFAGAENNGFGAGLFVSRMCEDGFFAALCVTTFRVVCSGHFLQTLMSTKKPFAKALAFLNRRRQP